MSSDKGRKTQKTEVLRDQKEIIDAALSLLRNAKGRLDACTGVITNNPPQQVEEISRAYLELLQRGTPMRVIGQITKEKVGDAKALMGSVQIRHMDGISSYFGVSDSEYMAVPSREEFNTMGPILYSNEPTFVRHHQALFDMLWERAIPADIRIEELEGGEELGETKITFSTEEIFESANRFVDEMKEEALVISPREGSIKTNRELFQKIAERANKVGAKVKILGRFSSEDLELLKGYQELGVQVRTLASGHITSLGLGIYDRKSMGLVQYIFLDQLKPTSAPYLTGVISTSKQTIAGIATIFDSLWEETELRREGELMQDILTHDLRNYNQISMSNAEVLRERLEGQPDLQRFVDSIAKATDGSTELIRKTKLMANIMSSTDPSLQPVDLGGSLERSLNLVKGASPGKVIDVSPGKLPEGNVLGDSLLDEVFVNIISNAVKYTPGNTVHLGIGIEEDGSSSAGGSAKFQYWKVSIVDHGRGLPADMKAGAGMRYLGTTKGGGLGLSIARALVVDRYSGRIEIKDRVEGDYSQGTRVDVWLPRA